MKRMEIIQTTQVNARKAFFGAFCSSQLVNLIFYNMDYEWQTKMKILDQAKKIAKSVGRERVYLSDWQEARKRILE